MGYRSKYRTFAAGRTLEAGANFGQIEAKLGHGPAEGIAVDAQFFRGLALVAPVRNQHFTQVLPFEFAHGILVADSAGMHLRHKAVQFSFHFDLLPS
jgi:hypothetical protein